MSPIIWALLGLGAVGGAYVVYDRTRTTPAPVSATRTPDAQFTRDEAFARFPKLANWAARKVGTGEDAFIAGLAHAAWSWRTKTVAKPDSMWSSDYKHAYEFGIKNDAFATEDEKKWDDAFASATSIPTAVIASSEPAKAYPPMPAPSVAPTAYDAAPTPSASIEISTASPLTKVFTAGRIRPQRY